MSLVEAAKDAARTLRVCHATAIHQHGKYCEGGECSCGKDQLQTAVERIEAAIAEEERDEPLTPEWLEANSFRKYFENGVTDKMCFHHKTEYRLRISFREAWRWFFAYEELPCQPQTTRPAQHLLAAMRGGEPDHA